MTSTLPENMDKPRINSKIFKHKEAWKPKTWDANYEQIVALSCTGVSNQYLSDKFGYSKEHISVILNTPQALVIKRIILEKTRHNNVESDLPKRLEAIREGALLVMEEVMINRREELTGESPFAMLDRATKTLQGLGTLKASEGSVVNNHFGKVEINQTLQLALVETIKKADEAKRLHAGKP